MSEYTPTTEPSMEDIRADWVLAVTRHHDSYMTGRTMASVQELYGELFDRVIAARDAEVRAQALTDWADFQDQVIKDLAYIADDSDRSEVARWTASVRAYARKIELEAAFRENGSSDS